MITNSPLKLKLSSLNGAPKTTSPQMSPKKNSATEEKSQGNSLAQDQAIIAFPNGSELQRSGSKLGYLLNKTTAESSNQEVKAVLAEAPAVESSQSVVATKSQAAQARESGKKLSESEASIVYPDGSGLYNVNGYTLMAEGGTAFIPTPPTGSASHVMKNMPELSSAELLERLKSAAEPKYSTQSHSFAPVTLGPNGTLATLS